MCERNRIFERNHILATSTGPSRFDANARDIRSGGTKTTDEAVLKRYQTLLEKSGVDKTSIDRLISSAKKNGITPILPTE